MNAPAHSVIDGSLARTTVRLIAAGLLAFALVPPLMWAAARVLAAPHADVAAVLGSAAASIAGVGALSGGLALALWTFVFRRPVHAIDQAETGLRRITRRDVLTGLPNRDGLRAALERAIARWQRTPRTVGVLVIDLDRFRLVNDTLGQAAGDALLRSAAERIRSVVREVDVVGRLGADQFVVLAEGLAGAEALSVMARNLQRAFEAAHLVLGQPMVATLSIGIALAGRGGESADTVLQNAEVAMRASKAQGGGASRSFEPSMLAQDQKRLDLDGRLRNALRDQQFTLVYQPILGADGERITGVEALLRWADAQRGAVSPAEFIPVLEQTGLIVDVGHWVMREACRQAAAWALSGAAPVLLSVNVSPRQFAQPRFADGVAAALAETGFPAERLQLEVTEGLLLEPTPETLRKIAALVRTGVRLAIDDFGVGYSSLTYLKTFPLHTLKIDRAFVREVAQRGRDRAIVRAIIELGHALGLTVTAEGVETREQFEALRELGCDSLQGFLFSRPVGPAELLEQLRRAGDAGAEFRPTGASTSFDSLPMPA